MTPDRAYLAVLFEGAPHFLDRVMAEAPFGDDDALFTSARAIAHTMPEGEQIELIDAHPRLGAPPGSVSPRSYVEQGYDRPDADEAEADTTADPASPTVDVAAELDRLNDAYEARFGFRYCVFVAGRPRAALLPGFVAALDAERKAELHRAIDAVIDIGIDRHASMSREASS